MLNNKMKKDVYDILMMPIKCDKNVKTISIENNYILSGQKYRSMEDEDMSDFAVGFYEIIYDSIIEPKGILNENGKFTNSDFAGDTMNSFNSIANIEPKAGSSKKYRTSMEEWPDYLIHYYRQYHCLANFWVIPMDIGRKSAKKSKYDSMDFFLNLINDNYSILESHKSYYGKLGSYNAFCEKHFIENYSSLDKDILRKYKSNDSSVAEELVDQAINRIKQRALAISESEYAEKLWNYFNELGV